MEKTNRNTKEGGGKSAPKFKADECLGVSVQCRDVAERAALFARLTDEGYRCVMS